MAPAVAEQDHDARVEAGQARGVVYAAPGGVGKRFERRKQAEYKRPLRGNDATCDRIPEGFTLPENKPTSCIFIHVQVNFPLLILCVPLWLAVKSPLFH